MREDHAGEISPLKVSVAEIAVLETRSFKGGEAKLRQRRLAILEKHILQTRLNRVKAGETTVQHLYAREIGLEPTGVGQVAFDQTTIIDLRVRQLACVQTSLPEKYLIKREPFCGLADKLLVSEGELAIAPESGELPLRKDAPKKLFGKRGRLEWLDRSLGFGLPWFFSSIMRFGKIILLTTTS